jgi:hypothetical protein
VRRAALVLLLLGSACGAGDGADRAAFCAAYAQLTAEDPFDALGRTFDGQQLRTAFAALDTATDALARTAPAEADALADRYDDAVDELITLLAAADYQADQLGPKYQAATRTYEDVTVRLDREAQTLCP